MKEKRLNEFKGIILVSIGLMFLAALIRFDRLDIPFYTSHPNVPPKNLLGIFGAYLGALFVFLFGRPCSFFLPLFILLLGIKFFRQNIPYLSIARILGILILLLSLSSFLGMFNLSNDYIRFYSAGFLGTISSNFIASHFGRLGGYLIFMTFIILSFVLVTEILISRLFLDIVNKTKSIIKPAFNYIKKQEQRPLKPEFKQSLVSEAKPKEYKSILQSVLASKPKIQIKAKPVDFKEPRVKPQELKIGSYQIPHLDLLGSPPPLEARQIKEDLEASSRILEDTLEDFGILAKVTDIERGPVITRYELEPASGVKLNRIVALADDIALTMKAQSVRIIAPIPGKGRVGVEVPNIQSTFVYLKEVFASDTFQKPGSKLILALGKDITGNPVVTDLGHMPHLLIAGATGSGKTVCVNSLILSLLFKNAPHELKFLLIDPKMVELAPFNGLPHLLCPVVNDAKKSLHALNWVVNEMEERYRLLAKVGARNIEAYNEKQESLPFIVVVIDEFADLMAITRDQIESAVIRLAQLSRAVGIHLILATQRPSVDVITGVIKANLPARISFKVASKVDSRTVLDMNGADKLLGKGDMLFLRPGESKLIRIQGSLVSDKEIEQVVDFIKSQAEPVYDEEILKEEKGLNLADDRKDELYDEAVKIIMESNQASVSILQRRLRLGYTRAARIIDTMEETGLIGSFEGSKPRKILIDREAWLKENIMKKEEVKERV